MSVANRAQRDFHDELADLGFERTARGQYRRGPMRLDVENAWVSLSVPAGDAPTGAPAGELGRPGPWKVVANGGDTIHVADLPIRHLECSSDLDAAEYAAPRLCDVVNWALGTWDGQAASDWEPPANAEIEAWLGARKLTIDSRHARQATLVREPGRLALSAPILARVPADLPPVRAEWLRTLLVETQRRWRMVRLGFRGGESIGPLMAEVDFSGAPRASLESLLTAGLAALGCAVRWSIEPAEFLVDQNRPCRSLEICKGVK